MFVVLNSVLLSSTRHKYFTEMFTSIQKPALFFLKKKKESFDNS